MTARNNFRDIAAQIRSPAFMMDAELLALGTQALASLEVRKGEDIDEWARKLGEVTQSDSASSHYI
jgi:hypothetical protein